MFKYPFVKKLWELTGEVGTFAESADDERINHLYDTLSKALDACEAEGLIRYQDDEGEPYSD